MSIEKLRPTFTFTEDRLRELAVIVPEAFADGKINWDTLQEALGAYLEEEEQEHFGLTWPGKREARRLAAMPSKGTLVPQPGEGINEGATRNIFIEGDNLEVLKLLQKSYAGRVKMIYIDPPYNTGEDFIYPDDYREPLQSYLQITGQADEMGSILTTNTKSSGRFHSNWLNMMYPRLLLARSLLKDDGVILCSIDDTELPNLRLLMDEIFGQENFIETLIWKKRATPPNDREIGRNHEYILVYGASDSVKLGLLPRPKRLIEKYTNPDNDPMGDWVASDLSASGKGGRLVESLIYPITNPDTDEKHFPPEGKCWLYNKNKVNAYLAEGRISFRSSSGRPFLKRYLSEVRDGVTCPTIMDDCGFSSDSSKEIEIVFGRKSVFEFPKTIKLMQRIMYLGLSNNCNDIVLDFFAGSCTLAEAVLLQNRADHGNRQFIMIQIPEATPENSVPRKEGFNSIAEVGKERIHRVINRMQKELEGQMDIYSEEDLGFKVLCLANSNYKDWYPFAGSDPQQLEILFDRFETPLVEGWKSENLLTEILLLQGFPLDSRIIPLEAIQSNT